MRARPVLPSAVSNSPSTSSRAYGITTCFTYAALRRRVHGDTETRRRTPAPGTVRRRPYPRDQRSRGHRRVLLQDGLARRATSDYTWSATPAVTAADQTCYPTNGAGATATATSSICPSTRTKLKLASAPLPAGAPSPAADACYLPRACPSTWTKDGTGNICQAPKCTGGKVNAILPGASTEQCWTSDCTRYNSGGTTWTATGASPPAGHAAYMCMPSRTATARGTTTRRRPSATTSSARPRRWPTPRTRPRFLPCASLARTARDQDPRRRHVFDMTACSAPSEQLTGYYCSLKTCSPTVSTGHPVQHGDGLPVRGCGRRGDLPALPHLRYPMPLTADQTCSIPSPAAPTDPKSLQCVTRNFTGCQNTGVTGQGGFAAETIFKFTVPNRAANRYDRATATPVPAYYYHFALLRHDGGTHYSDADAFLYIKPANGTNAANSANPDGKCSTATATRSRSRPAPTSRVVGMSGPRSTRTCPPVTTTWWWTPGTSSPNVLLPIPTSCRSARSTTACPARPRPTTGSSRSSRTRRRASSASTTRA